MTPQGALCGPRMVEVRRTKEPKPRWCFKCRGRHIHEVVVRVEKEPGYYGPSARLECPFCHEDHTRMDGQPVRFEVAA